MGQLLLLPMAYAACGLVLSLVVHVASCFDVRLGGNALFFALHVGIFPLWLVVVLIANRMARGARRGDFWRVALSGCPAWMKAMTYGFFGYAVLNFVYFIATASSATRAAGGPGTAVWHGFSGHWMAFYAAGLAVLTTAYHRGLANLELRCPNGHVVGLGDHFCPACGAPVALPPELR